MGKLSGGSTSPEYSQKQAMDSQKKAAQLSQLYSQTGMQGPFGSVKWTGEGGNRVQNVELGAEDQQRQALIGNALSGMNLDPQQASQQYYDSALALQQPAMDRQTSNVMDRMVKMGIDPTSTGSQEVLGELGKSQGMALNQLSTGALQGGQNLIGSQIGNVGALSGQIRNPLAGYQQGNVNFADTYSQKYASDVQRAKEKAAGQNALMGTVGALGGAYLGGMR